MRLARDEVGEEQPHLPVAARPRRAPVRDAQVVEDEEVIAVLKTSIKNKKKSNKAK